MKLDEVWRDKARSHFGQSIKMGCSGITVDQIGSSVTGQLPVPAITSKVYKRLDTFVHTA